MDNIETKRRSISATLADIEQNTAALAVKGIDAREPEDREAYDIVCRIERRLLAKAKEAV